MDCIVEIITSATVFVTALVAFIVSVLKGKKQVEENLPMRIKRQNNIDNEINSKLEELKELVKADRVQVYDFHNGGHYANGRSALKTSCTYEVVRSGIKPTQMFLQNIPLSCISRFVNKLLETGRLDVTRIEDIRETMPSTYQLKSDMGIKSFFDIIINNKDGEPVGFLAVQYIDTYHSKLNENGVMNMLKTKFFIEEKLNKVVSKSVNERFKKR